MPLNVKELKYQLSNSDMEIVEMLKIMLNENDFSLFAEQLDDWLYVLWQEDATEVQTTSILEFSGDVRSRISCDIKKTSMYTEFGEVLELYTPSINNDLFDSIRESQLAFPISHFDNSDFKYVVLDTNP
jgi:hypothetical protein